MLIPWPLILKVFSRARLCCGISTQAGIIAAFHKALPNWRCSWSVTTQRHAWWIYSNSRLVIFGFFFLLENLFSRDNQRLGCQVSNLTIFSFSSYHFFLSLVNASKVLKLTQVLKIYRQVCITFWYPWNADVLLEDIINSI